MIDSKYKIGDKVVIRNDLKWFGAYDNVVFLPDMIGYLGKVVTITKVIGLSYSTSGYAYYLEGSPLYCWTNGMIAHKFREKVPEERVYNIISASNTFIDLIGGYNE